MDELLGLTIGEAGRLVQSRSVSVEQLVTASLERIEETEPLVHAYAHWSPDSALSAATLLDAELAAGRYRGPLHGIPVGVKDLFETADMPTQAGSRVLAGFAPERDATVVERLRAAGAVIVGKTVTHEFALGRNVPATRNPWDTSCYPGGSSAGSGVAVASRSVFAGIGTDTAGSVRIPASVNGIVGLKPTFGRVSSRGVIPLSPSLDCVGPLARTVEDCALVFEAISGCERADTADGVEGAVIGVERDFLFGDGLDPEVGAAVEAAVAELRERGATILDVRLPELRLMPVVGLTLLLVEASAYHRSLLRERRQDYEPGTRLTLELGALLPATQYVTAQKARTVLCEAMRSCFDLHRLDALVAPATPQTTVPLDELSIDLNPDDSAAMTLGDYVERCFAANVTGQPALSVPCGFNARGLPIGFQLLGRPFGEPTLFGLARAYERANDWHARAPELRA
jgi:Asp-tRNA(Asn)/Glu-tRNA(Gln) amidotransferase A subunit family amidase